MKMMVQKVCVKGWWVCMLCSALVGCGGNGDADDEEKDPKENRADTDTDTDTRSGTEEEMPPCVDEEVTDFAEKDADNLFGLDHVPTFDFYLPKDEWEALIENAVDEQYTEVKACFDGQGIGTVGLRFKGAEGSLYSCFEDGELICDRLSLKAKFNKYDDEKRFFGLKRLNFHNNLHDDSRMKERLAYDIYREMDIVAPRAAWAVVRVNGQSYGLYGMVEQIDGRFSANRFPEYPDGNVYKELWPTDVDEETVIASLRTNKEEPVVSSFLEFSNAIVDADEDDVLEVLGEYTDLDYWARYMAIDDAIVSYDGVTYFWTDEVTTHNHNYYFYEDAPGHFTLIPWDVEATFWINPSHAAPHWTVIPEDCDLTYEYWGGLARAPGCDRIFRALNTDLDRWRKAARALLDGPFTQEKMDARIDEYAAFIGEEARDEATPTKYTSFDNAVNGLHTTVNNQIKRLEDMIAEEE